MAGIDKRQLLQGTLNAVGGLSVLERVHTWNGLLVFNYHRIGLGADSQLDRSLWSATSEDFDQQVGYVKSNFDVIGLDDISSAMSDLQAKRNRRFAMITFDDGYLDNFELAYPILRTHQVPGVFFIATGFLDSKPLAWWDEIAWMIRSSKHTTLSANRFLSEPVDLSSTETAIQTILRRYYSLRSDQTEDYIDLLAEATGSGRATADLSESLWMSWDHVREMRSRGMSFGAHTVNHPILSQLSLEEQNFEICESRLRLEHELGESITALSYPVGRRDSFNDDTRQVLQQNGFDWAFSYYGGLSKGASKFDRFDMPRVAIESGTTFTDLRSISALPQIFARH